MSRLVWAVPVGLMAAGAACVVAGGVLGLTASSTAMHVVGYVLSPIVAFTCVALFRRQLRVIAVRDGLAPPATLAPVAGGLLVAGLIFGILNAAAVADAVARWPVWSN